MMERYYRYDLESVDIITMNLRTGVATIKHFSKYGDEYSKEVTNEVAMHIIESDGEYIKAKELR